MLARTLAAACLLLLTLAGARAQDALPGRGPRSASIGLPSVLEDVRLQGGELETAPVDDLAPVVLRIVEAWPDGEDQWRYKLEWRVFVPGEHDLVALLRRKDGSSTAALPKLLVQGVPALDEAGVVKPAAPPPTGLSRLGGYRAWAWFAGAVWFAGLVLILRSMRAKRAQSAARRATTLAERLRPLVERAARGELDRRATAQLEAALVALWRRRLGYEDLSPADCIERLKAHADAGPLLAGLERWLHAPKGASETDVAALLAPYKELRADEFGAQLESEGAEGAR